MTVKYTGSWDVLRIPEVEAAFELFRRCWMSDNASDLDGYETDEDGLFQSILDEFFDELEKYYNNDPTLYLKENAV